MQRKEYCHCKVHCRKKATSYFVMNAVTSKEKGKKGLDEKWGYQTGTVNFLKRSNQNP